MGKKLDFILGRTFRASNFKELAKFATYRLSFFKNQRHVRCNQAHSDVLQLLQLGHHERALLRVDHVIKEQNTLDVYVMMEGYLNLVVERVHLIEQHRVCPDEVKEAISSLIYASSRCGNFPELQEIRNVFTSRFGKEYAASAVELRNHCGVNPKMIQKLSTRQPDLDSRMKLLKKVALENNIVLQLEEATTKTNEKLDPSNMQNLPEAEVTVDDVQVSPEEMEGDGFTNSAKARKIYRDVADAAQAAFEPAARAAVELSRSYPQDPNDQNSPRSRRRNVSAKDEPVRPEPEPVDYEVHYRNEAAELKDNNAVEQKNSVPTSSANPDMAEGEELVRREEKDIAFDESDDETPQLGSEKKIPSVIQAGLKLDMTHGHRRPDAAEGIRSSQHLNRGKGPFSLRIRGVRGY